MPLNTNIPMSYEGIQLDNPMNAMANAEKIKAMQMENALAEKQMNQQEDPRAAFINQSKAVVGHIKENLPILNENNADAFFKEVSGLGPAGAMASDSWFKDQSPAAQKLQRLNAGFNPPKQQAAAFSGSTITGPDGEEYVLNKQTGQLISTGISRGLKPTEQLDYQGQRAATIARQSAVGESLGKSSAPPSQQEVTEAQQALMSIDKLIKSDLDSFYGKGEKYYPDIGRKQENLDLMAENDRIVNLLKLASAGKLKGQGTITDPERQMLAQAATTLSNKDISGDAARQEWMRIRPQFEAIIQRGQNQPAPIQQTTGGLQKEVVKTGMHNGRRVVQYSDGTVDYAN